MVRRHLIASVAGLGALALAAASPPATAAPQGAPMVEPTPFQVMRSSGREGPARIARPQAMGQSTRAIMMPHPHMPPPAPGPAPAAATAPHRP